MNIKYFQIVFTAIFFLINHNSFSQSSSPYSRFGIGDIEYSYSIRRMGMGHQGISLADADFISVLNPASLYRLGKTRIEFSLNFNGRFLSNDKQKKYYAEGEFGGFALGIPVSSANGIGIAFGLVPYSNVSYNVSDALSSNDPLIGDYEIRYSGNGGLSRLFLSSSYLLPIDVSLGASLDYYFGSITYNSLAEFANSSAFSGEYKRNYEFRGIGGSVGLISPDFSKLIEIESVSDFRIGMALNLFSNLTSDSLFTSGSLVGIDTVGSGRGKAAIPNKISLGLSFVLSKKFLISVDYSSQAWSKYKLNDFTPNELRNSYKISTGFEYRPARELGSSFWEQIILRAGLSFEQNQYFINNNGIDQYSLSVGASLPLGNENTIDFAVLYAKKGTKDLNLFQEDLLKVGIGLSLGELWFIRQDK